MKKTFFMALPFLLLISTSSFASSQIYCGKLPSVRSNFIKRFSVEATYYGPSSGLSHALLSVPGEKSVRSLDCWSSKQARRRPGQKTFTLMTCSQGNESGYEVVIESGGMRGEVYAKIREWEKFSTSPTLRKILNCVASDD